jgi:glycosyltransferase involved in cell wall biosynthesis
MALDYQPLLTIAIPTFNREVFLDRALDSIHSQIKDQNYPIEIIVSNNNSQDNSEKIVEKYINQGLPIQYIKNAQNMGADFNIVQCYKKATGKYVVVFGDDDIFNAGAINRILYILNKYKGVGLFFLNWRVIDGNESLKSTVSEILVYEDYVSFYDTVNQSITFISGMIVNSSFVKDIEFDKYKDSCLIQVPLFLEASFNSTYNIIHKEALISVQPENSGGYSFSKVFGENISKIFEDFSIDNKRKKIFDNIKVRLLMENFPVWIYRIKTQKNTYTDNSNIHTVLFPVFSKYFIYWLFVYPIIIIPNRLMKILWPIYKTYKILLRLVVLSLKPKSNIGKSIIKLHFDN